MSDIDPRLIQLSPKDNIAVLAQTINEGDSVVLSGKEVTLSQTLKMGHKLALHPIAAGTNVLKYGLPIGFASNDIPLGAHVHVHNLTSRYTVVEVTE